LDTAGVTAINTMIALDAVHDIEDVAAYFVGTIYELAMRQGMTPRSVADKAFTALLTDEAWRMTLEPALREVLGRTE
jgi:hypothetical protein